MGEEGGLTTLEAPAPRLGLSPRSLTPGPLPRSQHCSGAPPPPRGPVGVKGAEQEGFEAGLSLEGSGGDISASHFLSLSQTRDNPQEKGYLEAYQ